MTRYTAETSLWGEQEVFVLGDREGGRQASIARHGAALLRLEIVLDGVTHDLADGYRDAAEIVSRPSSRFAIMVPFGGRISEARYTFDGQAYDLQPGVTGAARAARHGFVRGTDFDVVALSADADGARLTLATSAIRPCPGYPHAIDLTLTYTLHARGLALEVRMRNVGDSVAPCFFGWHPYFRLPAGGVDDWQLQIPAQTLVHTDANLIALPGKAAYVALDDAPAMDFREPRPIGDSIIDQGYTDLAPDADGHIRTRLRDTTSGVELAIWQERGLMHAFTADTVTRDVRGSVALEPMECMANAFDRPDCADTIRLQPGAERVFRCGVDIEIDGAPRA